jgi:hypothetical protein
MIVETSLPIGKLLMNLPANGLVFLVIPKTKESPQCMSHCPASYIQFYIHKLLIFLFSLLLYASETCLTWNWEGLYLPALVNSVDYKDCELNARLFFFFFFFIHFLTQSKTGNGLKHFMPNFQFFPLISFGDTGRFTRTAYMELFLMKLLIVLS